MKKIPASLITVALSLSVYSFGVTTQTWLQDTSTDSWNTPGNWSGGIIPGFSNETALFDTTAPTTTNTTITVSPSLTALGGITFKSPKNITLTPSNGAKITLDNSPSTTATILVNPSSTSPSYLSNIPLILASNLVVNQATDANITFATTLTETGGSKTVTYQNTAPTKNSSILLNGLTSTYTGTTTIDAAQVRAFNNTTAFPLGGTLDIKNAGKVIFDSQGPAAPGLKLTLNDTSSMSQFNPCEIYLQSLSGTGVVNLINSSSTNGIHFKGSSAISFPGKFTGGSPSSSTNFNLGSRVSLEGSQTITLSGDNSQLTSRIFIYSGNTLIAMTNKSLGDENTSFGSPVFVMNGGQLTLDFATASVNKQLFLNGLGNTTSLCPTPDGSDLFGALLNKTGSNTVTRNIVIGWTNLPSETAKDAVINTQSNLILSGSISGTGGLIKTGPADLSFTLSATNGSYLKPITILYGTFTPSINSGAPFGGDLYIAQNAALNYTKNQTLTNAQTIFINGTGISNNGAINITGTSTTLASKVFVGWNSTSHPIGSCLIAATDASINVTVPSFFLNGVLGGTTTNLTKIGTGALTLNNSANTFAKGWTVAGGELIAPTLGSISASSSVAVNNGSQLTLNFGTAGTLTTSLTLEGQGKTTMTCQPAPPTPPLADSSGALYIHATIPTDVTAISGAIGISSTTNTVINTNTPLNLSGSITTPSASAGIFKSGTADLTFTGSNTNSALSAPLKIFSGTFTPAKTSGTPFGGDLYIANGAALIYSTTQKLLGTQTIFLNGKGISNGGALVASGTNSIDADLQMGWSSTSPCSIAATDANVQINGTTTLNGHLLGVNSLIKQGTGELILTATNPGFSGPLFISAGTVTAKDAGSLGSGSVTILNSKLTLDISGGGSIPNALFLAGFGDGPSCPGITDSLGAIYNQTGSNILTGVITVTSDSVINTNADLAIANKVIFNPSDVPYNLYKTGAADLKFTGSTANTFKDLIVLNGTFTPAKTGVAPLGGDLYIGNDAALNYTQTQSALLGTQTISINGTGINNNGAIVSGAGILTLAPKITVGWNSSSPCTISSSDASINVTGTSLELTGVLAGTTNNLTKIGSGNLILSGTSANTLTGNFTVSAGQLTLSKTGVNAIVGDLFIKGGSVIDGGNNQISPTSTINLSSGTLNLGTYNEEIKTFKYTGGTLIRGTGSFKLNATTGTDALILGNGLTLPGPISLTGCGGGIRLIGTSATATISDIDLGLASCSTLRPIFVDHAGSNLNITKSSGSNGFEMQGPGTLTFAGPGPHNYGTVQSVINGGTVVLNTNLQGNLLVNSGANLYVNSPAALNAPIRGLSTGNIDNFGFTCISGIVNGNVKNEVTGTLAGTGTIKGDLENIGILSTGACSGADIGTLTVNGNTTFEAGSTFLVNISPTIPVNSDLLNMSTGKCTIKPGAQLQIVPLTTGDYPTVFFSTIISSSLKDSPGALTGAFTLVQPFPFFQFSINYDYEDNTVRLQRTLTGMPCQINSPIASIIDSEPEDYNSIINDILFLNCDELATAFDQMDPSSLTNLFVIQTDNNRSIQDTIWRRQNAFLFGACDAPCPKGKPYTIWMEVDAGHAKQRTARKHVGYRSNSAYVTLGADYHEGCDINGGIAASYSFSKAKWNQHMGNGSIDSGYVTAYATKKWESVFLGGTLGGQYSQSKYLRNIVFGNSFQTTNHIAESEFSGRGVMANIQLGMSKAYGPWYLRPLISADFNYHTDNKFSEKGVSTYSMNFKASKHKLYRIEAGFDLVRCFGALSLDWKLGYLREQRWDDKNYTALFLGTNTPITFKAFSPNRNLGITGLEATYKTKDERVFARAGYNVKFGKHYINQLGSLETGVNF